MTFIQRLAPLFGVAKMTGQKVKALARKIEQQGSIRHAFKQLANVYIANGVGGMVKSAQVAFADRHNYDMWIKKFDQITDITRLSMRNQISKFELKPLISVVIPVYNPSPEWLWQAIESVKNQIYENWEVCIADDASTDPAVRALLCEIANDDSRVKVVFREQNGHISVASNTALQMVTGEWVALLDHDDKLSEHALFWVVDAINRFPNARLFYSDEDKIDVNSKRSNPYFKPDWNKYLFYSQNMISHLGVYESGLIKKTKFRVGMEGSQDYDLALRIIEQIDQSEIIHIPKVLYHWRQHNDSTASSMAKKPYAAIAGEKALNDHFQRIGLNANAEFVGYGYRTHYHVVRPKPMVSIIIPTRDKLTLLQNCVNSIIDKTCYDNYEIIVIDNGSSAPETINWLSWLTQNGLARVIKYDKPFNYSALINLGAENAKGDYLALLNNDLEVISPNWLEEMIGLAIQPDIGAVGARLWFPNDTLQHCGVVVGMLGCAGHAHKHLNKGNFGYFGRAVLISEWSAVTAACLVVAKEKFIEVGGLNEHELKIAFNDVDFCLKLKQLGYKNVYTPYAELYHFESASRGHEDTEAKRIRFSQEVEYMKATWPKYMQADPAYSRNLNLKWVDFGYMTEQNDTCNQAS